MVIILPITEVTQYRDLESKLQTWQKVGYFLDVGGEIKLNQRQSLIAKLRFQNFGSHRDS